MELVLIYGSYQMTNDKKGTLVVNLLGGPGCGKSTNAALLYGKLKNAGVNVEYVSEFAKDLVWEQRHKALSFQPYITTKQMYRQFRLLCEVEVIVTDSPIPIGLVYKSACCTYSFPNYVLEVFDLFNNYNIFLKRDSTAHRWNPSGRNQMEEEAIEIDTKIKEMLFTYNIPYEEVPIWGGEQTANFLFDRVLRRLE